MKLEHAAQAVSLLITSTGGEASWSKQTIDHYIHQFSQLQDGEALIRACDAVAKTWDEPGRARIGAVRAAYDAEIRRIEMDRPALPEESEMSRNRLPPWREGVEIARKAYHQECYRLGKQPNEAFFESMLAKALGQPGDMRGSRR